VAEFIYPFITGGASMVTIIPFAGGDEAGVDAVAEVRRQIRGGLLTIRPCPMTLWYMV
jgi:hypothetical protein